MDKNDEILCLKDISLDNIPRCPNCNLISSLQLKYKEGKPIIDYNCENNHKGEISLEEYLQQYNKFSLIKQACDECKKNQNEKKGDFFYCCKCNKFLCHDCGLNHPNNDKHNCINFKRYDSFCKIHYNSFAFYCLKCKKNLCIYCKANHPPHNIKDLFDFNYSEESKKNLEESIKNIEKKIKDLDVIKQDISLEIDKLKKSCEFEMKFFKILINAFKYEEIQKNLNYNVIQNLKNFEKIFGKNKAKNYEKIYKEGIKFIDFLKSRDNFKFKSNNLENNIKTLTPHNDTIYHISQLNDGRLISSSVDQTLNIYNKDTLELQFTIKGEHSNAIRYFTQLSDDRIITCSDDATMKIIRLTDDDKFYSVEQTLKEHNNDICKVIEIRDNNKLISVSRDRTMKIWEIKNNNKFECTNTKAFQSGSHCNILQLNDKEFVTSSENDKCIKFWNLNDYSNIATLNNIECNWGARTLCELVDDILGVGGNNGKGIYLIRISNHQLINNINGPQCVYSIYKCFDDSILCAITKGNGNCAIVKYKYENGNFNQVVEKERINNGSILYSCFELEDGKIATAGAGPNVIKLWE